MFIAPIAKSTELVKSIAKNSELSKTIADELHSYTRYDARNVAFPTVQKAAEKLEYFSPSTPIAQNKAVTPANVGKVLDIIH